MKYLPIALVLAIVSAFAHADGPVFSANPYLPDSTSNPYGVYGSPYSPDSVGNPYGLGIPVTAPATSAHEYDFSGLSRIQFQTEQPVEDLVTPAAEPILNTPGYVDVHAALEQIRREAAAK